MPKINRMRIVNFSYNNNNRHILDETFDFFGGENVLFSLANGGGKSVLVQAMLQPILPKASLLGRKIGDFFAGRNTPSFILLEWKLDDHAGYLLTGIAIMPNTTHSANEEEQTANIRYFTFFHEYSEGNALDIKHIPVTEQIGNHLKIASYSEFRKYIKKEEDKSPYRIGVFASDRVCQAMRRLLGGRLLRGWCITYRNGYYHYKQRTLVPYLLLAAACYAKGSENLYNRLIQNRILGEYILNYRQGKGIPLSSKIVALILLWSSIASSLIFFVDNFLLQIVLLLTADGVTIHLMTIKTYMKDNEDSITEDRKTLGYGEE